MTVRRLLHACGLTCALLLGAEAAARLDDWLRRETPLLANPERDRDLMQVESWGFRGRPHGRYRKWTLDANGFRITPSADEGPCLLILGASETFGLYESPEKEYPAQLARLLQEKQPCRVLNASLAGISLHSLVVYWDNWAGNFNADYVLLYPSPHFYLDTDPPHPLENLPASDEAWRGKMPQPRLRDRVKELYHSLPAWLKEYREEWTIRRETAGKAADWLFQRVPEDRLHLFEDDLRCLLAHIRARGAEPILATHAISASSPPRSEDETYLRRMRMYYPRATTETLVAFEQQANEAIRRLAKEEQLALVDADRALSGRRELFADLVHFNDEGAALMAHLLVEQLPPLRHHKPLASASATTAAPHQ